MISTPVSQLDRSSQTKISTRSLRAKLFCRPVGPNRYLQYISLWTTVSTPFSSFHDKPYSKPQNVSQQIQNNEFTAYIFSDHNGRKPEDYKWAARTSPVGKTDGNQSTFSWITNRSMRKLKRKWIFFERNENTNSIYQKLCKTAKASPEAAQQQYHKYFYK